MTDRLTVGDPGVDSEFKLQLTTIMDSHVTQAAKLLEEEAPAPADAAAPVHQHHAVHSTSSSTSPAHPEATGHSAMHGHSNSSPPRSVNIAEAASLSSPVLDLSSRYVQSSKLRCKVDVSCTLRVPHPLSIVPAPLLSSTGSMVARLAMQALLPSFLELLAVDYARWAAGGSTSVRQATPAGSLVPASSEHSSNDSSSSTGREGPKGVELLTLL